MGTAIEGRFFRQILGHYPTGVCVVTTVESDGRGAGMVVGSFTSVSLHPPLVAFFPDKSSTSWPRIEATGRFCVNILADDQEDLCRTFSRPSEDRFAGVSHRLSANGSPILDGALAWIDCTLHAVHEAGDHYIVLGEVQALDTERDGRPLLFFKGGYGQFAPILPPGMS
ncbi:flavin reductase family protein [Sphingobium sp. AN641]|uniref:flavin reductase family protein n=1 Tax=Sphingobium sp. AN641 TaxID=3133443 RepID=UPI0030BE0B41